MRFAELADVSRRLAATSKRSEKAALLADLLRRLAPAEIDVAVGVLTGAPRQGRIGVGWATLRDARVDPSSEPSLTVLEVDETIDRLAAMGGAGVVAARRALLVDVFGRATEPEQDLLWKVLGGELRQGALDGVMVDAVARAAERSRRCGAAGAHADRRPRRDGTGGDHRGRRGIGGCRHGAGSGRAADAGVAGTGRRGCARGDRAGVGGVEARRGAHPGPPPRRPGADLHPQPQRDHRPPRRRRRPRRRAAGRRPRARW